MMYSDLTQFEKDIDEHEGNAYMGRAPQPITYLRPFFFQLDEFMSVVGLHAALRRAFINVFVFIVFVRPVRSKFVSAVFTPDRTLRL